MELSRNSIESAVFTGLNTFVIRITVLFSSSVISFSGQVLIFLPVRFHPSTYPSIIKAFFEEYFSRAQFFSTFASVVATAILARSVFTIPPDTKKVRLTMRKKQAKISFSIDSSEEIVDIFNGIQVKRKSVSKNLPPKNADPYNSTLLTGETRCFRLSFHKKHKELILSSYMHHVLATANELKEKNKTLRLFTLKFDRAYGGTSDMWQSLHLDHPSIFHTLTMDLDLKKKIIEDLNRFMKKKEYYKSVGKVWKRGYLLVGPPDTEKSSLIAAMANYLNFDVYDLELTKIRGNSELRKLLISTGNKSIPVAENINCSLELHRLPQSTNHKDRLDHILLHPGRIDVQIHMSYITPCGFRILASNKRAPSVHGDQGVAQDYIGDPYGSS